MRVRSLLLFTLGLAATPNLLAGQTIRGTLIDQDSGDPLPGGSMTLLTTDSAVQTSTPTDSIGGFLLSAPGPARYLLRAAAPGYITSTSPPLNLEDSDTLDVEFSLSTAVAVLDPVVVTGSGRSRGPLAGFYRRLDAGIWGTFVTREEIERRHPIMTTEMLRTIPGIRLVPRPFAPGNMVVMRGSCIPNVFVDGMRIRLWGGSIDDLVSPQDLEGIEVYRNIAEIPVEYGGLRGACGAVLLWTRRG